MTKPRRISRPLAPALSTGSRVVDIDKIPDAIELHEKHDGFYDAFYASVVNQPTLRRSLMRCVAKAPADVGEVSHRAALTFQRRAEGIAEMTDVVVETTPESREYAECVESSYLAAGIDLPLPDSVMDDEFQVRDEGKTYIDPYLTIEIARKRLSNLQAQLSGPVVESERPIIEMAVELYLCYLDRGLHRRRECLSDL